LLETRRLGQYPCTWFCFSLFLLVRDFSPDRASLWLFSLSVRHVDCIFFLMPWRARGTDSLAFFFAVVSPSSFSPSLFYFVIPSLRPPFFKKAPSTTDVPPVRSILKILLAFSSFLDFHFLHTLTYLPPLVLPVQWPHYTMPTHSPPYFLLPFYARNIRGHSP